VWVERERECGGESNKTLCRIRHFPYQTSIVPLCSRCVHVCVCAYVRVCVCVCVRVCVPVQY